MIAVAAMLPAMPPVRAMDVSIVDSGPRFGTAEIDPERPPVRAALVSIVGSCPKSAVAEIEPARPPSRLAVALRGGAGPKDTVAAMEPERPPSRLTVASSGSGITGPLNLTVTFCGSATIQSRKSVLLSGVQKYGSVGSRKELSGWFGPLRVRPPPSAEKTMALTRTSHSGIS